MNFLWKALILQMAENDIYIFYVKRNADEDGAMELWL